jgi:RNA polymerase sporulation-specific sigma factor
MRDPSALSDEALCALAREGDTEAVEVLLLRYLPMVRRQAGIYRGGRIEVEDLMQEGMVGLFRAIKAYNPEKGASFKTFAYTCVGNRMLSALVAVGAPATATLADAQPLPDPQQLVIDRERYAFLLDSMQDILSLLESQTLRLYLSGATYEQIAAHLGVTTKSVDNALQRVRRKLKAVL